MTVEMILLAVISGLTINEFSDLSPWAARKLVRWSAHRRYTDSRRALDRADELAAVIDVRPGKLLKVGTALGFVVVAITFCICRAIASRTPTTIRRAIARLSPRVPVVAGHGWYLDELRTVLRLDTPSPEAHEHRRIVATRDGVSEIMAWFDFPRRPGVSAPHVATDMIYGGRLVHRKDSGQGQVYVSIQLPTSLRAGDSHEYGLILRITGDEPMQPRYVFTPECQCNKFDLRVRFDQSRPPQWVQRVQSENGLPLSDGPSDTANTNRIPLDNVGEVHLQFDRPAMYCGYGAHWQL